MEPSGTNAEPVSAHDSGIADFAARLETAIASGAAPLESAERSVWDRIRPHLAGALRSWVVLSNAAFALLAETVPLMQDAIPSLRAVMPAHEYAHAVAALAVLNIALRFRTRESLAAK